MNKKFLLLLLLLATTGSAQATILRLDITGTIDHISGSASNQVSQFAVGDRVAYQVTLDDGLAGPGPGGATRDLDLVSNFRALIGGYRARGSSGDVFLRNNGTTGVFQDPYDQFSLGHFAEPVYAQGFGMPGRTDFTATDGNVGGFPLSRFSLNVQHPDVEFVGAGENVTAIAQHVADNIAALEQPAATNPGTPTIGLNASFMDEAFGSVPVYVEINVDSYQVNPAISTAPLAFGTAAAAISKDVEFGNAVDTYRTSHDDLGNIQSSAFAFSTNSGQAAARATITDALATGGELTSPGLEVGAFASGAGGSGQTASRALAFRTFGYEGDDPLTININNELHGFFDTAPFGLPDGSLSARGGIYVFDAIEFADAIDWLGGDLDAIFFPLANKHTDLVDPNRLDDLSPVNLLGIDPLAAMSFNELVVFEEDIFRELMLSLDLINGQQFTVLYDLSTTSNVQCFGGQCGAGASDFYNSLSSAPDFFTDQQGNPITSIAPLMLQADVPTTAAPVPASGLLLAGGVMLLGLGLRRREAAARMATPGTGRSLRTA